MTDLSGDLYLPALPDGHRAEGTWGLRGGLAFILFFAAVMIGRQVLWMLHAPVSQHTIAQTMSIMLIGMFALFVRHVSKTLPPVRSMYAFNGRLVVLTIWVGLLVAWGWMRDNIPSMIFKEAVVFLMIIMWLYVGRFDSVWEASRKPLLIILYGGLLVILLTYRVPGAVTTFEGTVEAQSDLPRNLATVGYSCRVLVNIGLLTAAWGMVRQRNDLIRWLLLGGLPVFCFVHILLFEFRGAVVLAATLVASYALILPVVRGKVPIGTMALVGFIGVVGFLLASQTQMYSNLMYRFGQENIFATRMEEAGMFFKQMNILDLAIGRGMGGWYRGPVWATGIYYHGEWQWSANHFGLLGFVLRGGYLMLLFMCGFVVPAILPKPREWYRNEYNLAALVLAPVLLANILLNPILFLPEAFLDFLMWGFCFARFCTPVTDHSQWTPEPQHEQVGYAY